MRTLRLLGEGHCFYHCISRVVDRRFIFGEEEKEFFRKTMRCLEEFTGVQVVTYCIMDNHIHLLLGVPDKDEMPPLTEETLLTSLEQMYDAHTLLGVQQELERALKANNLKWHQEILDRYEYRRGSLSEFMKTLKQRFTQWYNRTHSRRGTIWEARYKSVLVEDTESALLTMAAYIDLNPVRAGMVSSPEDYRWCGYSEAVAGKIEARRGLAAVLSEALRDADFRADWRRTHNRYRQLLFEEGEEVGADKVKGTRGRKGFRHETVEEVIAAGGKLSVREILRHRVRYFCDGAVFGTVGFVNKVFERERIRFGPKRKTGARRMRGAEWGKLRVLRDLQQDVFGE